MTENDCHWWTATACTANATYPRSICWRSTCVVQRRRTDIQKIDAFEAWIMTSIRGGRTRLATKHVELLLTGDCDGVRELTGRSGSACWLAQTATGTKDFALWIRLLVALRYWRDIHFRALQVVAVFTRCASELHDDSITSFACPWRTTTWLEMKRLSSKDETISAGQITYMSDLLRCHTSIHISSSPASAMNHP